MPLIPKEQLEKADKILFIAHLAIGDFTYLQNCFKAFSQAYPHIRMHLWIDEVRRTSDSSKWGYLKDYALYDWAENCGFFDKVYRRTYSPELLQESIAQAQAEAYPIVVSLATLRPPQYARLARACGPQAWVVGMKRKVRWYVPTDYCAYRGLDATFAPFRTFPGYHITDEYADWFMQLARVQLDAQQRFPFIDIPPSWQQQVRQQLADWGIPAREEGKPLVFINPFAKTRKRCWPVSNVADLIHLLQAQGKWHKASFIINAMPHEIDQARKEIADRLPSHTFWFSADQNFYQLPAMLQCCDLVVSVETAVMHLANAVHVPVVALMRRKNPEWAPFDKASSRVIMAARRSDWVDAIPSEKVRDEMEML